MGREFQPGVDKIPESWVKERVKSILKRYSNILIDMPPASMYGNGGRHDFIICQEGKFWTIETKSGYNKPSELQIMYADQVNDAGGRCYVINEFNYVRVYKIADSFAMCGRGLPSDDFERYRGGKEYASKEWGTDFSGRQPRADNS